MFRVYIIQSKIFRKYYIGHCEDILKRFKQHNLGKVRSTKHFRPWEVIYTENFQTKSEAVYREKQITSYKGGEAFKKLISK